ncbi:tyrosine-type recombinase/integrase [Ruminococcus flavefaciens]|uniref:tyrosine-type recombinase/integrase n=1 Tax=Ruminococcus flavefaciens TaxID=1265 RepID=UPI00048E5524|nr:tyrosine-type recombinase/integrase [Ruminococcus flavefaciens]
MKNVTGSLQTKRGKYYAVLNLYDHTGKRKQKWISTGYEIRGNKKAAKAFLDELLVAYNKKQQAALKVISKMKHPEQFIKEQSRIMALPLFLYIEEWIDHSSAKLQPTTIDGYRQLCNGRIRAFFESRGTTVYDLTEEDLNEFYAYLAKQGLKGASQQRYHGLIHSAYSFLMKHQYIDSNPCDFADRPKAEKYRGAYYNQSELTELFRAAKESEIYIPVLLAAYYGLRRSEVLGIKWSNIDFENGTIRIAHKVVEQKVDGKYQTVGHDKMKTESSNRILPLMKEVAMALRSLKLHQDEQRRLCGNSYVHEYDDYVCVNEIGQLLRPNYVTAKFSELLKENGLKHIRYHDLRHSCASLLLANGVPMKEIQEWLGHSNYRTTADVYSHLDFSSKEHSAEIISHVLAV